MKQNYKYLPYFLWRVFKRLNIINYIFAKCLRNTGLIMDNRYVIIMAGGVGSRFWPLSRHEKPKQFLDILGTGKL